VAKDKSKGKDKDKANEAEAEAPDPAKIEGEGEEGEGSPKKKLPLRLILIAAAGAFVVLGGGGGAAFIFLTPKPAADAAHAHKKPPKSDKKDAKDAAGGSQIKDGPDGVVFYTMPDILVNMQTADGKPTFLKLKLTFELPDRATAEDIEPELPRLTDMFQTFLRELRPEDLSGSQGEFQLKMEIQRRVNLVIAPAKVNAVLIEEQLIN
jgi:flagellar FliL protein